MATVTSTLKLADKMTPTLKKVNSELSTTQKGFESTNRAINGMKNSANGLNGVQGNLRNIKNEASGMSGEFRNASNSIGAFSIAGGIAVAAIARSIANLITQIPKIGDELINVNARIGNMAREGETVAEINENIYQSALRSRGEYVEMAGAVSKLGILAGDAFANTDEIISFTESMQKAFKVGGAGADEMRGAMHQLTQAMASGRLQGDEFVSIKENAPLLAQAIADYVGVSMGELKELSTQGLITSDVIKGAMDMAADEIEEKFDKIGYTTSDSLNMLKAVATHTLGGIAEGISGTISSAIMFMAENFDLVIVVLTGIAIVVAFLVVPALWAMIPPILTAAAAFAIAHAPLLITVGIVMGLLLLFLKFQEALGVVVGAGRAAITTFANVIKFIGNGIVGIVNLAIKALNKLPGVNIAPVAKIAYDSVKGAYEEGKQIGTDFAKGVSEKLGGMKTSLANMTKGKGTAGAGYAGLAGLENPGGGAGMGKAPKLGGGKLDKIGKIEDDVEISEENLKWLKDIATKKFQINYQQLTPSLTASFGDIKETADVDNILTVLENKIVEWSNTNLKGGVPA